MLLKHMHLAQPRIRDANMNTATHKDASKNRGRKQIKQLLESKNQRDRNAEISLSTILQYIENACDITPSKCNSIILETNPLSFPSSTMRSLFPLRNLMGIQYRIPIFLRGECFQLLEYFLGLSLLFLGTCSSPSFEI